MFRIADNGVIHLTRGDIACIEISAVLQDGSPYTFRVGDVVRFRMFTKSNHSDVKLLKDVTISTETEIAQIFLDKEDTKIGEIINKPVDYWYEVEVNPDTEPQTIIGYDDTGAKVFRLYPEGDDV